jgi:hypothetical protein
MNVILPKKFGLGEELEAGDHFSRGNKAASGNCHGRNVHAEERRRREYQSFAEHESSRIRKARPSD